MVNSSVSSRVKSQSTVVLAISCLLLCSPINAEQSSKPLGAEAGWTLARQWPDLILYTRLRAGSPIKEFKAIGKIEAPTVIVNAVLNDSEGYVKFMPYTTECRVLKREEGSITVYQRIAPKIAADRDYTLRVRERSWPALNGIVFSQTWSPANDLGPPPRAGIVRVSVCEGGWLLEPEGEGKTRGTYTIYTDSGGAIPSFLANYASQMAIKNLFAAIRKQSKDPKYRTSSR
jgi:coenzyme Q-binding protein COQ10